MIGECILYLLYCTSTQVRIDCFIFYMYVGILTLISEELSNSPLYYTLDHLSSVVHCTTPSMIQLRSAIMRCGYEVSGSHAAKLAIKTNAPNNGKNEKYRKSIVVQRM